MDLSAIVMVGWFPVLVLLCAALYVYVDAPHYGLNPKKWAAIAFFVPFFGFFAYIFERGEKTPDDSRDMFEQGRVFEIHESRADEVGIEEGGPPTEQEENEDTDEEWGTDDEWGSEDRWNR